MKYKRIKAVVLIILFLMAGAFYSTDRNQNFEVGEAAESLSALENNGSSGTETGSGKTSEETKADSDKASEETKAVSGETSEASEAESLSQSLLHIHVCGAVKKSGVYEIPEGSIVEDALNMAGGVTKDGAADYLNLAEKLEDGEKIYVPYTKDLEDADGAGILSGSGADSADQNSGTANGTSSAGNGLVNINTATKEELTSLNGIGDSRAQAIIDYRTENGAFASIEDIMLVSGIKEGAFAKIKDQITV